MNDPITILTGALMHAQGRFDFYATNHEAKADKLKLALSETPEGLDPESAEFTQKLIDDTLEKAAANRDESAAISRAIQQATAMVPSLVRVVPLDLLGAALYCVGLCAPNGPTQAALRRIAYGDNPGVTVLPDDVRLPGNLVLVGSARHTALWLDMSEEAHASLSPTVDHMDQLIAFHGTYGVPMLRALDSTDPNFQHMTNERVAMRLDLIAEEVIELFEDGLGVTIEMKLVANDKVVGTQSISDEMERVEARNGVEVADALGDIVYLCYGMALEMGYDLRKVIAEIHASNLTKLGADGVPIMREDGKVLKGPNYQLPNIAQALGFIEHEAS